MIFEHYLQLLRTHRRLLIGIPLAAAGFAALVSLTLLFAKPSYQAKARVMMLPSDAEMAFSRGLVGSEYTATTLTETHIEYLQSRGVAEMVVQQLRGGDSKQAAAPVATGATAVAKAVLSGVLGSLVKAYYYLNYGTYVPPDPEDAVVSLLMSGTEVVTVQGSYILEIRVTMPSPDNAARAANALADVYVQRVGQDLEVSASELGAFLSREIAARESELDSVLKQETALRSQLGLTTSAEERTDLASTLELERKKQADDQVQIEALQARLTELGAQRATATRQALLAQLEQEIALGEPALRALISGQEQRTRNMARLDAKLRGLEEKEQPLDTLLARRDLLERDLRDLRERSLDVFVSRSSTLSKVRIIDPAVPPTYPKSPQVFNSIVLGGIAGLVIFAIVLVALDTFSNVVVTPASLAALTGGRGLGRLDASLVAALGAGGELSRKASARLAELGAHLERRLAVTGSFDQPVIQVTGFLADAALEDATLTLAAALAARGHQVACGLAGGERRAATVPYALGDKLSLQGSPVVGTSPGVVAIEACPPVAAGFTFREAAQRSSALLCVVPAGTLAGAEIEDFQKRAEAQGLSALSYALLD